MIKTYVTSAAIVGLSFSIGACSRTLPPTESRLGSGTGIRSDYGTGGRDRSIPGAFSQGSGQYGQRGQSYGTPFAGGANGADRGDTVYFTSDSVDLTPVSQQTLAAQARWLARNPGARIIVEGHADERGTREYNIGLGQKRAEAVRTFLVRNGVDGSRIRSTSFGKERPVASCPDISCWSQNRRAQTVLVGGALASQGYGRPQR